MKFSVAVVSDSTGETAESLLHAALAQFDGLEVAIERYRSVTDAARAAQIPVAFGEHGGQLVVSTLVKPDVRTALKQATSDNHLAYVTMMEPLVDEISRLTGKEPQGLPGINRRVDGDYLRRVKAIEFTLRCDDGQSPELLEQADIVLFGVSRAGKTPLSIYLSMRGYCVSNVPLLHNIKPDKRVWNVDEGKRVGLMISPERLQGIRSERIAFMGIDPSKSSYANLETIKKELGEARALMESLHCRIYDSTDTSFEKLAQVILEDLNLR